MHFAGEEEEGAEEEEEDDWAGEVRVVHDVLIYSCHWVEDCEGLLRVSYLHLSLSEGLEHTFPLICPKFTPSSSNSGGSPSYPSVPKAASHPVLNPPCSPMRPLTGAAPKPELYAEAAPYGAFPGEAP